MVSKQNAISRRTKDLLHLQSANMLQGIIHCIGMVFALVFVLMSKSSDPSNLPWQKCQLPNRSESSKKYGDSMYCFIGVKNSCIGSVKLGNDELGEAYSSEFSRVSM